MKRKSPKNEIKESQPIVKVSSRCLEDTMNEVVDILRAECDNCSRLIDMARPCIVKEDCRISQAIDVLLER